MTQDGVETCDQCGSLSGVGNANVPDVYFREPYMDPHLIDYKDVRQKDGVYITSKRQKAEIMKKLGFREAGDRKHGARNEERITQRGEREKGHAPLPR